MSPLRRSVALLGATGSIGVQTLDVLRREREQFELVSIAGGEQLSELAAIASEFNVKSVAVKSERHRSALAELVAHDVEIVVGDEGLGELSQGADVIVNAVLGFAGLPVTLGALSAGKRLALANKESLIAAAPLVAKVRHTHGAALLPIDSEHCAVHQCLASSPGAPGYPDVKRIVLTASGGPFRGWSEEQLKGATKEDALHHPTWSMGAKITIDSSTLMNKGLEVLEASALFGIDVDRIDVVVHPQSIVHSMVEYVDGSVLAQLSRPDMRLPIAYCLGLPERLAHAYGELDFTKPLALSFEPPDAKAFPALGLAYEAARVAGAAPAWLSAANEVAVAAFLADEINWCDIVAIVTSTMDHYVADPLDSLSSLYENDDVARRWARASLER
ncbi:MAG TPA: 1-deoxy-D-xylulose-5-phosphate reductoisomerase [Acidimicrobiales bacterium]|jgi:1-deoxy-D-xylulose-5-phosphate reductoisomerase|nr:1-deoxy-D-xylulose-5-phosphate reductoisomerase [Acidimicrobiales bacterium]